MMCRVIPQRGNNLTLPYMKVTYVKAYPICMLLACVYAPYSDSIISYDNIQQGFGSCGFVDCSTHEFSVLYWETRWKLNLKRVPANINVDMVDIPIPYIFSFFSSISQDMRVIYQT